jgi:hypothetical protein
LLCTGIIVWINIALYTTCSSTIDKKKEILLQLNFLSGELKNNHLGEKMQAIFPEGFVFTNVLYGLSWCELAIGDTSTTIKQQALQEAIYAFQELNKKTTKGNFDSRLYPEYGIFYCGWRNYLLSKILFVDSNCKNNDALKIIFKAQCDTIVDALQKSNSPYLESYHAQCWPADMCVAMASVSNHEKIFTPKYKPFIKKWLGDIKAKLDKNTTLIPHKVDYETGNTIEGARGCSISLILRLMTEIDTNFANEQYQKYMQHFATTTFGLPSIREYPKGQSGFGDVDSGPVIFGVGFAGTIVSIGTHAVFEQSEIANYQYQVVQAFGFSFKNKDAKKYVFGLLPIADAFIAWSTSSGLSARKEQINPSSYNKIKFHIISLIIILTLWILFYAKKIVNTLLNDLPSK